MTLQWTVISTFLYIETAIVMLLLLPTIRPWAWSKLFRSNAATAISKYMYLANITVVFMALMFLDALRDVYRYTRHSDQKNSAADVGLNLGPTVEMQIHVKMFRAQRNLHISGFALMLWFVIHRLVQITVQQARLMADNSVLLKQAEGASRVARDAIGARGAAPSAPAKDAAGGGTTGEEADHELERLRKVVQSRDKDLLAIQKQSANLTREYDRLMGEHEKLQQSTGATVTTTRAVKKAE